jgi:hypothetical protein
MSSIAMYLLGLDNVYEFRKEEYSHRRSFWTLWYFIEFISILPLVLIRFYLPLSRGRLSLQNGLLQIGWSLGICNEQFLGRY